MNEHFTSLNPSKLDKLQELIHLQHKLTLIPIAHIQYNSMCQFGLACRICVMSRYEYLTKWLNLNSTHLKILS